MYREQKDYDLAEALFEDILASQRASLGQDHPDTLRTLRDLGKLKRQQGDWEGAQKFVEQADASFGKLLGTKHPETWECALLLASISSQKWNLNRRHIF